MIGVFRQRLIEELIAAHGDRCQYCKIQVRRNWMERNYYAHDATVDHVIPKSKGGTNDRSNLVVACRRCNNAKGNRSLEAFLADPRPDNQRRKARDKFRRKIPVQYVSPPREEPKEKIIRGTLAWAISIGEMHDNGTYKSRPPSKQPAAQPRGRKMNALELARWLRESAERKGKPWPLA